ncbi:CCGSCS motif protein [Shewanella abyssi]|uniref:CCGSCS motif protein n=1 Tax=Shewanella abyssi TaxID=311789 RepID=UPI00200C8BBA|nr:CCGSCS motif protein [Shewanella abyssi]MCL1048624.1 CCGSCS motif protein [Shewanella abyssi]
MSVSFKKIFGLNKSESQASVLTPTKVVDKAEKVAATNAAVKADNAKPKHGDSGVCCGSCSN